MNRTKEAFVPRSLYLPKSVDRRLVNAARRAGDYISQHARKMLEIGLETMERKTEAEAAASK